MAEGQTRGGGRVKLLLVTVVVVFFLGVIAYLAGQLNAHRYYLVRAERELVVHRGAPIPFVTRPFMPLNEAERIAYAPIRVNARWGGPNRESFNDRPALDRAIFAHMEKRLRDEFYGGRLPNLERIDADMKRINSLTGITDEDRRSMGELQGDYAYLEAREIVEGLGARLNEARRLCDLAEQKGTGKLGDPRDLSRRLAQWMQLISSSGMTRPLPPPQLPRPSVLEPSGPPPSPAPEPAPGPVPETAQPSAPAPAAPGTEAPAAAETDSPAPSAPPAQPTP